jgi:hypothetical protein
MESLPSDMLGHILDFVSTTESWSLSRCNKTLYARVNPMIYSLFEKAFLKRALKITPFIDPRKVISCECEYWIMGSLVWSTLMGVEWDDQDVDLYVSANKDEIIQSGPNPKLCKYDNYDVEISRDYSNYGFIRMNVCIHDINGELGNCFGMMIIKGLYEIYKIMDLEATKSYWFPGELCIQSPEDTLFGRSAGKVYSEYRHEKYISRGMILTDGLASKSEIKQRNRYLWKRCVSDW